LCPLTIDMRNGFWLTKVKAAAIDRFG